MENKHFVKLSLDTNSINASWEIPYDDVSYEDMMRLFKNVAIAMTFDEKQFLDMCVAYIEDYGGDEYQVNYIQDESECD